MTLGPVTVPRLKGYIIQFFMLLSINVPTVSFGLAMGWVSLASGAAADEGGSEASLVGAAAATFMAGMAGVPVGARALQHGRRLALALTSAVFSVCWALTLAGGWWVVIGRLCAGAAGSVSWCIAPLLGKEMISRGVGGAAAAAPVLAHNLGILLMYLAADARIQHSTVVWCCLALSTLHCGVTLLGPESPAYLAAKGRRKEAVSALAWLRGLECDHPALAEELRMLPPPETIPDRPLHLIKEMLSESRRRRAFLIALIAVVGQESCGVLTLIQFAEKVFLLAGEQEPGGEGDAAARHALVLGAVQLAAAAVALYLLERLGRRPLAVWGAVVTGACLALAAGGARAGRGAAWAGRALAAAVAADSLGLQPAPYAILADMFHYQYRSCAVLLVMAGACAGNAAETLVFPAVVHTAGLWAAFALAASITLLYALFAIIYIPETKNRTPEEIYDAICPKTPDNETGDNKESKSTVINLTADHSGSDLVSNLKTTAEERNKVGPTDEEMSFTVVNTARTIDSISAGHITSSTVNDNISEIQLKSSTLRNLSSNEEKIDIHNHKILENIGCDRKNAKNNEQVCESHDFYKGYVEDLGKNSVNKISEIETSSKHAEETQCTNL